MWITKLFPELSLVTAMSDHAWDCFEQDKGKMRPPIWFELSLNLYNQIQQLTSTRDFFFE